MLRRGQLSRIRGSKPQSRWYGANLGYHWWTEQAPFFSLRVKYRTKWAISAIEKPVKLSEGKVLDVFFSLCSVSYRHSLMLSHHRERRADSCKSLQSMNYVYISSHTHTHIYLYVCTHVCLYGCLWCQHMPRFIIPQSLRQHAEPGTMTCVEMRPIAAGWVDHWATGPWWPWPWPWPAAIEVPSMKRGNGSARAGAMRASSWTQRWEL